MTGMDEKLFETPIHIDSAAECNFYHTTEIPGVGLIEGQWDLRDGVEEYLGGYDFTGKRILESCARLVTDTIIIAEMFCPELDEGPVCSLIPTEGNDAWDSWWRFTPRFFTQFLEVLGFTQHQVTFHEQRAFDHTHQMYTIVSSRA